MAHVDVDAVAKTLNMTPRRVQQLVKEGMPRAGVGLYDLGVCMHWYIRYLQKALEARSVTDGNDVTSLTAQRIRQAREAADKAALENARRRGNVIDAVMVSDTLQALGANLNNNLESLPDRHANELAGNDAATIKTKLRAACRRVRSEYGAIAGKLAEACERAAAARKRLNAAAGKKRVRVGRRKPRTPARNP